MSQIVHFNVGGTHYSTSVLTIMKYPDSMLAAMIDQENEQLLIQEGKELFIDRNGKLFEQILDFYRMDGMIILPNDEITLKKLNQEADYFVLPELKLLISEKISELRKFDGIINLNVGGIRYSISLETYKKFPHINNSVNDNRINNGKDIFIDRDGHTFRYVLDYLRNGHNTILPDNSMELQQLKSEAEYYKLTNLKVMCANESIGYTSEFLKFKNARIQKI